MLRVGFIVLTLGIHLITGFFACWGAESLIRRLYVLSQDYVYLEPSIFNVSTGLFLLSISLGLIQIKLNVGLLKGLFLATTSIIFVSSVVVIASIVSGRVLIG